MSTLGKLVPLAVAVTAAAGAFSALLSWYYQPYLATGHQVLGLSQTSAFNGGLFDLREVAFPAWTLAAFATGALAGMLIRRVVPAIAATLAVYAGLAVATGLFLREHYLTPLRHHQPERARLRVDPWPVVDQGRRDAQSVHDATGHGSRYAAAHARGAARSDPPVQAADVP